MFFACPAHPSLFMSNAFARREGRLLGMGISLSVGRVVVGMSEELGEPLDARIPEALIAPQPGVGALELSRLDATVVDASAHGALYEPGALECLDVLGRRGQRHPVWRGQLAHGELRACEALEHGSARAVAEGAKDEVEML